MQLAGRDAPKVDATLKQPGLGIAIYQDAGAINRMVMSYGTFRAELPGRYPPANCGELTLRAWCPPMSESSLQDMVSPLLLGVRQQQEQTYQIPTRLWSERGSRTEHPGQRTGADSILMPLGLEPEPTQRFIIADEREPEPAPPPPPPEEPKKLRSYWDRFK
jgi:hypothetical protein